MRQATLAVWAVVAAGIVVLEGAARAGLGRIARLSDVFVRVTRTPVGRGLLLLGWMWLGWHLFAR